MAVKAAEKPTEKTPDRNGDPKAIEAAKVSATRLRDLDAAIRRLPPEQREVLLLVALEEMSYDEAAGTLGIPIGTVMSRLARAREKLRAMLSGLPPGGGKQLKIVK